MSVPNKLVTAVFLFLLTACAAVNTPDGGPRDETPPKLRTVTPASGTTNFTGKVISLTFDEDVRPKDINQQLIITPNTDNPYTVRTGRRELILEFNQNLEPNTTYFLNFREGVEDITEGNKALPVMLSFSTGPMLDTGSVNGKVTDYITGKPEANITVALYPSSDTSNIRDHKPYYFTKSSPDGSFILSSIKTGDYWIFAHQDKNNNEFYDQEKEKIAYLPQPISINPKADSVQLKTVFIDTRKPFVLKTENFLDKNTINYNEGIQKLELKTLENPPKTLNLLTSRGADGKRVDIYPAKGVLPARVLALATDSAGLVGTDTLKLALSGKKSFPDKLTYRPKNGEVQITTQDKVGIEFVVPVQLTGNQPFTIVEDSIRRMQPTSPKDFTFNENNTVVTFNHAVKARKSLEILVDTTKVTAVNDKPFSRSRVFYTITDKSNTGSMSGSVKTDYKNYTLEVLNDQGKVLHVLQNPKTFKLPALTPGNYNLRVKIDENNDGKWSLGDRKLKTMPEKLYVYPKPVTVRANWEIEDIILIF